MTEELLLCRMELDEYVKGLSWSPAQDYLFGATAGGSLYIFWSGEAEMVVQPRAHKGGIICLAASPAESRLVTGGCDNTARLWDGQTGVLLKEIQTDAWVEHAAWSPDGNFFAVAAGKHVWLFDKDGAETAKTDAHNSTVTALCWRSDSKKFATAAYGGARVYSVNKPEKYEQLVWNNSLISITWSRDQRFILAGTQDSSIHVWKMDGFKRRDMAMHGYASKARAFAWDNTGKKVATNCGHDIVIWDTAGKNGPENTKPEVIAAHSARVTCLAYQPGENTLVSGDESGRLYWWMKPQPEKSYAFVHGFNLGSAISHIAWNKTGALLAAGTAAGVVAVFES
jgi:WD40 repeat protein